MKQIILFSALAVINTTGFAAKLSTEITINASIDKVWKILTDFDNYAEWNPFIKSIEGDVIAGNKIDVEIDGMKFRPKVLQYDENSQLVWIGRLGLPGIFDGKHSFKLLANEDGTTTFIHSEQFKGLLVPFFKKKLMTDTKNGFLTMNNKLKELAENTN